MYTKNFLTCVYDTFRLIIAALITLLFFFTLLYLLPIKDIPNILPDYLLETAKDLSVDQKKVVNDLYINGKLTDPKGLYGEIVEYYHFLVFLVFALLALVGGFVYLQIRQETTAKINSAIKRDIAAANIKQKISKQISGIDIDKKIEQVIDQQAVGDTVMETVISSDDYLHQLTKIVSENLETDILEMKEEIAQLRGDIESVVSGIEDDLGYVKGELDDVDSRLREVE